MSISIASFDIAVDGIVQQVWVPADSFTIRHVQLLDGPDNYRYVRVTYQYVPGGEMEIKSYLVAVENEVLPSKKFNWIYEGSCSHNGAAYLLFRQEEKMALVELDTVWTVSGPTQYIQPKLDELQSLIFP